MITTWEELGEVLAEFENRISLLENSLPSHSQEVRGVNLEPIVKIVRHVYASKKKEEGLYE
ncbi:hypothetical protein LCGC14_0350170 [marine sediment metagenome]|uniref:Uncharacterized protein n=1 Tax=marine sediment metagenome TaxID=412755 RepID=A0A0F9TB68_9ZZZZ